MRGSIGAANGKIYEPGDWLDIGTGVGRFSGVWENPELGLMGSLTYFRRFDDPTKFDTIFFKVGDDDVLERAVIVAGPLKRNGKRPDPVREEPALTVIEGGKS